MGEILTEGEIIRLMREEYDKKLEGFLSELDASPYSGQEGDTSLVSPMLKVRHNKSGLLYTIVAQGMDMVTLRTPEGAIFHLPQQELERDYELD